MAPLRRRVADHEIPLTYLKRFVIRSRGSRNERFSSVQMRRRFTHGGRKENLAGQRFWHADRLVRNRLDAG
jgi:hypothetical protein